jgi:hypothetical protein
MTKLNKDEAKLEIDLPYCYSKISDIEQPDRTKINFYSITPKHLQLKNMNITGTSMKSSKITI